MLKVHAIHLLIIGYVMDATYLGAQNHVRDSRAIMVYVDTFECKDTDPLKAKDEIILGSKFDANFSYVKNPIFSTSRKSTNLVCYLAKYNEEHYVVLSTEREQQFTCSSLLDSITGQVVYFDDKEIIERKNRMFKVYSQECKNSLAVPDPFYNEQNVFFSKDRKYVASLHNWHLYRYNLRDQIMDSIPCYIHKSGLGDFSNENKLVIPYRYLSDTIIQFAIFDKRLRFIDKFELSTKNKSLSALHAIKFNPSNESELFFSSTPNGIERINLKKQKTVVILKNDRCKLIRNISLSANGKCIAIEAAIYSGIKEDAVLTLMLFDIRETKNHVLKIVKLIKQ